MIRLSRRAFVASLASLGASAAGLALTASACGIIPVQPKSRVPRIGFLAPGPRESQAESAIDPLLDGLRELGYIEGQTITIEWRFADYGAAGRQETFTKLAAELAALPVDVIVTVTNSVALAAQQATTVIPIVAIGTAYPVETGLVDSLRRPGRGNLTAVAGTAPGRTPKKYELIRALVPGVTTVVALVNVTTPVYDVVTWNYARSAAEEVGLHLYRVNLRSPDELEDAIAQAVARHPQALIGMQNPLLLTQRYRLAELALQHRLPLLTESREYAAAGALLSDSGNTAAVNRRGAKYVDKILNGARPADLPVEQPMVFDLVVNLTTANVLGITFPPDVVSQVTEWLQ